MARFKMFCGDCGLRVEKEFVGQPIVCAHCGSDFIAVKELSTAPSEDVIARVRKLANDGLSFAALQKAFNLDVHTLMRIISGDFGEGRLQPQHVPISERVTQWIEDQRRRKILP